jgi:hypothetical protein
VAGAHPHRATGEAPLPRHHEAPNLWALNFLLHESLGGGGTVSLRLDAQGKTLSHALLAMEVRVPKALVDAATRGDAEDGRVAAKPAPEPRVRRAASRNGKVRPAQTPRRARSKPRSR